MKQWSKNAPPEIMKGLEDSEPSGRVVSKDAKWHNVQFVRASNGGQRGLHGLAHDLVLLQLVQARAERPLRLIPYRRWFPLQKTTKPRKESSTMKGMDVSSTCSTAIMPRRVWSSWRVGVGRYQHHAQGAHAGQQCVCAQGIQARSGS